jgi:hypothetical protein
MKMKLVVLTLVGAFVFAVFASDALAHRGGRRTGLRNGTSVQARDGSGGGQGQGQGRGQYRKGEGSGMGWHRDGTGARADNRVRENSDTCKNNK